MSEYEQKLPSPWWANSDGEATWLQRHDASNQDELFWCDDEGAERLNDLERQLAEANSTAGSSYWKAFANTARRQRDVANAALAEAKKGLERIAAPESDAGMMAARATLARIEALKVQPEVAQ